MNAKPLVGHKDITVWLVEDNHTFRNVLVRVLRNADNIVCARSFANAEEALELLTKQVPPDVFLFDVELPGLSGIEAIKTVKRIAPTTYILMLTVFDDEEKIFRAIRAGASGYLLKTASVAEITNSIREVVTGGAPMTPTVARSVLKMFAGSMPPDQDYGLTEREQRILELMTKGLIKKEIADELVLSYHTVDTHMRNIYSKMHVHTGTAAVAKALNRRPF